MKRKVILWEEKPGMWYVQCPAIGANSQGNDYEDALRMIKEACELHLEMGDEPDMDADPDIKIAEIEIDDNAAKPKGFRALSVSFNILSGYQNQSLATLPEGQVLLVAPAIGKLRVADYEQLVELGWTPTNDHLMIFDTQGDSWHAAT